MAIARMARSLAGSLGVNTHVSQGFSNTTLLLSSLNYLGISNIRDGISGNLSIYQTLANAGVRFDMVYGFQSVATTVAEAAALARLGPTALRFMEGPNEVNLQPVTYNGVSTTSGSYLPAAQLQAALYRAAKADATVHNIPVISLTSGGAEPDNVGLQYLTIPTGAATGMPDQTAFADYANVHVYPDRGSQNLSAGNRTNNELSAQYGLTWAKGFNGYTSAQLSQLPKVMTEFGYPTTAKGTDDNAVSQSVQASNTLNMIMDALRSGYSVSYIYELLDDPNLSGNEASYGLFSASGTPKAAATAIHNLTSILADTGQAALSFTPGSLNYSVSNLPSTGGSLLFQKSNGAFDIVVWNEGANWNAGTHTDVAVPVSPSIVDLGLSAGTVEVFDPRIGATPIQTLHDVSQVRLGLTDHPLIVQVEPVQSRPASPNNTVVKAGSDATITDTLGNAWSITRGAQVAVNSIADTTTADVTQLAFVNGAVWQQNAASLWWSKSSPTATWLPPAGTSVSPLPVDTLVLRVSEDAWHGDANFAVSVDGKQIGGVFSASALHTSGTDNMVALVGNWGRTSHAVGIKFINDAYGGSPSTDRNLYVTSIGFDGVTYAQTSARMGKSGTTNFTVGGNTPVSAALPDTLIVHLAEDAWSGDAQFTLTIDGKTVTTPQSITASHAAGAWQDLSFSSNLGAGSHVVGITFTNDAYGGSSLTDRNLYINGLDVNGKHYGAGITGLYSAGTQNFTITADK